MGNKAGKRNARLQARVQAWMDMKGTPSRDGNSKVDPVTQQVHRRPGGKR